MSMFSHARAATGKRSASSRSRFARLLVSTATFGAAAALVLHAPLAASAATGVTVSPNVGPASGFTTSVSVAGTEVGHTYRVGICSRGNVGTPAIAPACQYIGAEFAGTGGAVTRSGTVDSVIENAHFGAIPGQPATFDCGTTGCEIVVTDNHSSGSFPTLTAAITFN